MWKKCKVVMLATDKRDNTKSMLWLGRISNRLRYNANGTSWIDSSVLIQHLYILSDDEIKEGDWILTSANKVVIALNIHEKLPNDAKKVIATTDSSLRILKSHAIHEVGDVIKVPLIPQSFIEKYVSEYNKGNKIEEVMVEYEDELTPNRQLSSKNRIPKINPDNTINIKSIKDSWTREEIIKIIHKFNYSYSCSKTIKSVDNWIENNL